MNNKLFPSVFCSTDGRQQLLSIYKQVTETLLDSKNDAAVIRALGFVQSCYLQEWYFIRYHNFNCSDIQFNLFAEVNTEMYAAVESIDINKLQNTFYWPTFTQIILRDAVFLLSDEAKEIRQDKSINNSDNNEISNSIKMSASIEHLTDEEALLRSNPDINAIEDFCGYLGFYVSRNIENANLDRWGRHFQFFSIEQIYGNNSAIAEKIIAEVDFRFLISQIQSAEY